MKKILLAIALLSFPLFAESPVVHVGTPEISGKVSVTEGTLRMRRRHENDMDFSKYNPFYWQGRGAKYRIEDYSSTNQKRLVVTLETESKQKYIPTAGPDFSAVYTGDPVSPTEHLRSKFLFNIRMNHVRDLKVFTATLDEGAFNAAGEAMKIGQVLTMEFRFFLDEQTPEFLAQKAVNPHSLSAYYSEFVRIKIGEPGLLIDDPFKANGEASQLRYSGGRTTTPTARVEPWKALQQMSLNLRPENAQAFLFGRAWFHTDFDSGRHVSEDSDDKPSVFFEGDRAYRAGFQGGAFNAKSCVECHHNNGTSPVPLVGVPVTHTVFRTADTRNGALQKHGSFLSQIQPLGPNSEGAIKLVRWDTREETLDDGTKVELRKPVYDISSSLDKSNLGTSVRRPLPIIGMGLLEAIPESKIREWAAQNGGTVSVVDGRIGRFGWKSERATVREQIISAMTTDLGVKLDVSPYQDCVNCKSGKGNLFTPALNDMETYVSLLGVPPRLNPEDQTIKRGALVFGRIGCGKCHVQSVTTGRHKFAELSEQNIQPFTDLLLHDMGDGLADSIPNVMQKKWRTTPLWANKNVKHSTDSRQGQFAPGNVSILWTDAWKAAETNTAQFLHDGRARNYQEAIMWHGGEAEDAKQNFRKLHSQERAELFRFLGDI